jgi:hypothetical protein
MSYEDVVSAARAESEASELPFIDTHTVAVDAPPEVVFETLERLGPRLGTDRVSARYARLVGCEDKGAFHLARSVRPELVVLEGSHRFSRYQLAFRIEPSSAGSTSTIHADTRAVFPGLAGGLYRAAVIRSGGHRVAMRLLLAALRGRVQRATP